MEEPASETEGETEKEAIEAPLVFPNPCSEQFDLSERGAVLFDAAVAARNRTPNSDICIPEVLIYGEYEQDGQTILVCMAHYYFFYGCDGTEHYTDNGGMCSPAKAVLARDDDGTLQCISFTVAPDGAGATYWAEDFCDPLTDLRDYFLHPDPNVSWPLTSTMPSPEELFPIYIRTYQEYLQELAPVS